jgi:uracil-DNA glycosylase
MEKASADILEGKNWSPQEAARTLDWLIAMGADEIVSDTPLDRFALSAVVAKPAAKPQTIQAAPILEKPRASAPTGDNAETVAAACQSLEELQAAMHQFDTCGLRKTATHTCFIGGKFDAPILVLGDRARDEEEREGLVFAGKNAALLDNMLKAIGLGLDQVMTGNLIPWRPPGNRQPLETEIRHCAPFMRRAIALAKPMLILSLGGLGGATLAGGEASIARQRGKWLKLGEADMIATFHPDDLLKSPARKKLTWADLLMFRTRMNEVLT